MATPTEALNELNKIKDKHEFLKTEILKLLDENKIIINKLNGYSDELEKMEESYVELMSDLTTNNG